MASKVNQIKIILIGDSGVGKSSLMNQYINRTYEQNSFTTIGVEFLNKEIIVEGKRYSIQIWDTGGQERFRSLRTPFYRGSDCCILVFAIDDPVSFSNLDMWRKEFFYYSNITEDDSFPFIVLANKSDVGDAQRKINVGEIESWCTKNNSMTFYETSAKQNKNVAEAFQYAIRQIMKSPSSQMHRGPTTNAINLANREKDDKCCSFS